MPAIAPFLLAEFGCRGLQTSSFADTVSVEVEQGKKTVASAERRQDTAADHIAVVGGRVGCTEAEERQRTVARSHTAAEEDN